MTLLPIVGRELRVAARQRGTNRLRTITALVTMLVGGLIYIIGSFILPPSAIGMTRQLGQYIFESLGGLALLYCLVAGRLSTADSLSEEKREGTLGLLFLTDLKGYDVVLGKMAATSVRGFYGLLAVFPVLAIPLLIGGITNGEFWRMVLVLVNTF